MPHALFFGVEIGFIVGVDTHQQRHARYHLNTNIIEIVNFVGVVSYQLYLIHTDVLKHRLAHLIGASIGRQTEQQIGIKRIMSFVMQRL